LRGDAAKIGFVKILRKCNDLNQLDQYTRFGMKRSKKPIEAFCPKTTYRSLEARILRKLPSNSEYSQKKGMNATQKTFSTRIFEFVFLLCGD